MEGLLVLLLFPLVWPFVAKRIWDKAISFREVAINVLGVVILVVIVWQTGKYAKSSDTEIWNGEVIGKEKSWVSCSHSYQCNCHEVTTGSGDNKTTTTECDTCYEHFNDWDWDVYTNVGSFTVDRIDRRGSYEPPRWTKVYIGEPVSREYSFVNYIKAAPDSLFNFTRDLKNEDPNMLPKYPRVFDYQYVDRVLPLNMTLPEKNSWNNKLAWELRKLGPEKEANVIIVVAKTADQGYAETLEEHWLGGKKNDIVVILGVPEYPKIAWAYVMSWTKQELFKIELRDALLSLGKVNNTPVVETISSQVRKNFVRRDMADFDYLKDEIDPPTWVIVFATILATAGSVGLSLVFRETDI